MKIRKKLITLFALLFLSTLLTCVSINASAEVKKITIDLNGGFIVEGSECTTENIILDYTEDSLALTHAVLRDLLRTETGDRYIFGLAPEEFRGQTPTLSFHDTGVVDITGNSVAVNSDGTYLPELNKVIPGGMLFGFYVDNNANAILDEDEILYRTGDTISLNGNITLSCWYETNMYFKPVSGSLLYEKVELVDGFINKPTEDIDILSVQDLQPLLSENVKLGNASLNEPGKKINIIELPDTVTAIGDRVFRNTSAKVVYGLEHIDYFGDTAMYNVSPPTEPLILSEDISGIMRDSLYWSNAKDTVVIIFTGDIVSQGYDGVNYTFLCRDGLSRTNPLGNLKQYIYVPYGQTKNYYPTYETYLSTMNKDGHLSSGNPNENPSSVEWRFNTDSSRDYLKMREYHVITFDLNGGTSEGATTLPITRMDARAVSVMGRSHDSEELIELNLRNEGEVLRKDSNVIEATYTLPNVAAQDLNALKASKPVDPVKAGKFFVGWEDQNGVLWTDEDWENGGRYDESYAGTVSLTARWADPVTVHIVSNSSQNYQDIYSYVGGKLNKEILPDPSPMNFKTFAGWYTSADFSGKKWDFASDIITSDMTLYAKWDNDVFIAKLYVYGGTIGGNSSENYISVPFVYGQGDEIPIPTKTGFIFLGWYDNSAFDGEAVTYFSKESATPMYYAKWESSNETRKIIYELNGGINSPDNPNVFTVGVGTKLYEATKVGANFDGWYPNDDYRLDERILEISDKVDTDITLFAKFIALQEYSISYVDGGENENPVVISAGEKVLLKNPSKTGYIFQGWYTDAEFTGEPIIVLNQVKNSLTLYAKWEKSKTGKISYVTNGATLPDYCRTEYTVGEKYYLTAPTKPGYEFIGWYTDASFTPESKIVYIDSDTEGDITVFAKFEKTGAPVDESNSQIWVIVIGSVLTLAVTLTGIVLILKKNKSQ